MKIYLLFFMLIIFMVGSANADDLYTWTDKDGVMHMGTAPPSDDVEVKKHAGKNKTYRDEVMEKVEKRWDEIDNRYEERIQQNQRESNDRVKQYWSDLCESKRSRERYYQSEYRNAKTQDMTDFYKRMLDDIEETCRKAN